MPLELLVNLAASPLWVLLTHMILARTSRGGSPQGIAAGAGILGAIPTAISIEWLVPRRPLPWWPSPTEAAYSAIVYLCLAYSYFHLFNMTETARRIRILREIDEGKALTEEAIAALYDRRKVLELRLGRLLSTGQIAEVNGRVVIAGRLLFRAALIVEAWRRLLGFDRPTGES
jgi:hypothetical protein